VTTPSDLILYGILATADATRNDVVAEGESRTLMLLQYAESEEDARRLVVDSLLEDGWERWEFLEIYEAEEDVSPEENPEIAQAVAVAQDGGTAIIVYPAAAALH
jgi:hypothetical protein